MPRNFQNGPKCTILLQLQIVKHIESALIYGKKRGKGESRSSHMNFSFGLGILPLDPSIAPTTFPPPSAKELIYDKDCTSVVMS